jgi:hypothetical protein
VQLPQQVRLDDGDDDDDDRSFLSPTSPQQQQHCPHPTARWLVSVSNQFMISFKRKGRTESMNQ